MREDLKERRRGNSRGTNECEGERAGEDGRQEHEKKTSARMTQAGENSIEIQLTAQVRKERQAMKAKTKQKRGRRATHRQGRREDKEETKNRGYQASNQTETSVQVLPDMWAPPPPPHPPSPPLRKLLNPGPTRLLFYKPGINCFGKHIETRLELNWTSFCRVDHRVEMLRAFMILKFMLEIIFFGFRFFCAVSSLVCFLVQPACFIGFAAACFLWPVRFF